MVEVLLLLLLLLLLGVVVVVVAIGVVVVSVLMFCEQYCSRLDVQIVSHYPLLFNSDYL